MKLNLDNAEYLIDQKNLLISFDHMLNDVIQHSKILSIEKLFIYECHTFKCCLSIADRRK
jgi:hypothetical protein